MNNKEYLNIRDVIDDCTKSYPNNNAFIVKNPDMKTTKKHEENHGKGIEIIREKTEKHNGYMDIYEKNGFFIVSAFLSIQSLPEN